MRVRSVEAALANSVFLYKCASKYRSRGPSNKHGHTLTKRSRNGNKDLTTISIYFSHMVSLICIQKAWCWFVYAKNSPSLFQYTVTVHILP